MSTKCYVVNFYDVTNVSLFSFFKERFPQIEVLSSSSVALCIFPFCKGASVGMWNARWLNGQAEKQGVCMPAGCISVSGTLLVLGGVKTYVQ